MIRSRAARLSSVASLSPGLPAFGNSSKSAFLLRAVLLFILFAFYAVGAAAQDKAEAYLDFKVNLTNVEADYHNNNERLNAMLIHLDSIVMNPLRKVSRISVVGTASPEGPLKGNIRLAENRAKAFIRILQSRYNFPDSIYTVATIPEDWDGLRSMLRNDSTIPYGEIVLRFLDESEDMEPNLRERRLKSLAGGKAFDSMRTFTLPYLRRTSVIVDYDKRFIPPFAISDSVAHGARYLKQPMPSLPLELKLPAVSPLALPRRRFFAIKTNLLGDAMLCANLGIEIELWPRWSLDIPVWYSPYDITRRWRIRLLAVQPEVRYWLKNAGEGHYFGVHASVIGFNVSFNGDYRYQDPNHAAAGGGLGYGYAFHLDKSHRWSMEAQIGVGFITYKWDRYLNTGRNGEYLAQGKGTYWGITRAGITLAYKFYRDRKERRWMKW